MIHHRKNLAVLLRVFAAKPDQVQKYAEQVIAAAITSLDIKLMGQYFYKKALIVVPADQAYVDSDCGGTPEAVEKLIPDEYRSRISLHVEPHGDAFCALLNRGAAMLNGDGAEYVTILSSGAKSYMTEDVAGQTSTALLRGAKIIPVAIDELQKSILMGRPANTFATWNVRDLLAVGGFNPLAAGVRKDKKLSTRFMWGWSAQQASESPDGDGDVYYPLAGVEEIIPSLLMAVHGPCIAPLVPQNAAIWVEPDPRTDPEGYKRSVKKMGTKLSRQSALAAMVGCELSVLEGAVMPEYRRPDLLQ